MPNSADPKAIDISPEAVEKRIVRLESLAERGWIDGESCEQRNMRMGWGCKCHGMTSCPDLVCVGYEDDVPIFERKARP